MNFLAGPEKEGHQFTTHLRIYIYMHLYEFHAPFGFCKIAKRKEKKREKGGRQWMVDQVPLRDAAASPLLCLFLSPT